MISPIATRLYDPLSPIETAYTVAIRCHLPELYSLESGDHGLPLITGQCPRDAARHMPRTVAARAIWSCSESRPPMCVTSTKASPSIVLQSTGLRSLQQSADRGRI